MAPIHFHFDGTKASQANKLQFFQIEAIENLGFGQLAKMYLYWKDPWWAPGEGGIQLAWPSDANGLGRYNYYSVDLLHK